VCRREHNDRSGATLGHHASRRLGGEEHAGEVDIDDPPPGTLVELEYRLQLDDRGGVHEDVQTAEPANRGGDRSLDVGGDRNVAGHRLDRMAVGAQARRSGVNGVILDVEQHQVRAFNRESSGAPESHPRSAGGNENRLAAEPGHVPPPGCPARTRIFTWSPAGSARRSMPSRTIWCMAILLVMTFSTGRVPVAIWARMRGVSQILKDQTPARVRSRQTHPSGRTVRSPRWSAMMATVAARRTDATQASS